MGPATGKHKVLRGGSWNGDVFYCHAAYRDGDLPSSKQAFFGFRLVCTTK